MLTRLGQLALRGVLCTLATTGPVAVADGADAVGLVDLADLEAAVWRQLAETSLTVPYGTAFSPVTDFGTGVRIDALRANISAAPGDRCGATLYSIDIATVPNQPTLTRYFPNSRGEIALPRTRVFKAGFVLSQTLANGGRCLVRLEGLSDDGSTPPPPPTDPSVPVGYALAGNIAYTGGFRYQEIVSLASPGPVDSFMAVLPAACAGLEVVEGGTLSDGTYTAARLTDAQRRIFTAHADANDSVSAVSLSLNGPVTLTCNVPVYIRKGS